MKQLLSEQEIREAVGRMAEAIERDYRDHPLTIVGIMTGSLMIMADLVRRLRMPLRIGVIQTSSYRGGTESGDLRISAELMLDIRGRDVLLIDDIFDTGHTLVQVMALMRRQEPRSVRSAVLLRKVGRQQVELQPDYVGLEIPDLFVVGYGLDYRDEYRNLPYIAALDPDDTAAGAP